MGKLNIKLQPDSNLKLNVKMDPTSAIRDYNNLKNIPSINGVPLTGDKTLSELYIVSENTTDGWSLMSGYIPKRGEICLYTDTGRLKIGDGAVPVIDLPYCGLPVSDVTPGSYGPAANATPAYGGAFSVPYVTVDSNGIITAAATKTITMPSYSTATSSDDGLMSATDKSKLDNLSTIQLSSGINMTEDTDGLIVIFVD